MNGISPSAIEKALQRQPAQECPSASETKRGAVKEILAAEPGPAARPPASFVIDQPKRKRRRKRKPVPKMTAGDLGLFPPTTASDESWGQALYAVSYWLVTRFGGGLLIGAGIVTGMRSAIRWWAG